MYIVYYVRLNVYNVCFGHTGDTDTGDFTSIAKKKLTIGRNLNSPYIVAIIVR